VELVLTPIKVVTLCIITAATIPPNCPIHWVGVGIDEDFKCVVTLDTDLKS